jgi:hypothetical protein
MFLADWHGVVEHMAGMTILKRVLILLCIAGSAVTALTASEHRGMVTYHGLPVPGAVVSAIQGDRKLTTSTGDDGTYSFRDLADGAWTIEVEMTGFAKVSREIGVGPGTPPPTWDLQLAPPPAAAAAPAAAAVARPGAPAPPGAAAAGRGGAPTPPGSPAGGRGGPQMTPEQAKAAARARIAAQMEAQDKAQSRAAAVAATSNAPSGGGDAMVLAGSVGGGGGGGATSFGNTLGGGSQYNGNAAFSLDNSVWDAASYSLSGIRTPKPAFAKGKINLSFGGPLKIPHAIDGKHGTFTLNYSMGRTRNATTSSYTVPTALERAGDFSQSVVQGPVTVYDPTTGVPFPGGKVPAARLSAAALTLANYYPLPNASGSRLNYQNSLVGISNQDNLNARLNQTLGKKDRLSGGVGWQRTTGENPNYLGFIDGTSNYGVNANVAWAHTYSKRLVQNVSFNFSRSRTELSPYFASLGRNIGRQLGIQGTSSLPQNFGPPNLGFTSGFSGISDGAASLSRNQTANLGYSINLVRTKHQWTFGSDFRRQQINPFSDPNGRGSFVFTGAATTGAGNAGGYDFADFLLDLPSTAAIRFGNADKYFRTWKLDGYVSDNWTVSKALTANLGLRYDYTAPYTEIYNRLANLDIGPGFGSVAVVRGGDAGPFSGSLPKSLIRGERTAISPNIGLAWRPFYKNPKMPTTVRFMFMQMHPMDAYSSIANNLSGQAPFAKVLSLASSPANPLAMETAFLNQPAVSNTYAVDPNYKLLTLNEGIVYVMQPLSKTFYTADGFVYVAASHLDQTDLPNSLPPGLTAPVNGFPVGYIYEQSNAQLHARVGFFQVGRNMTSGFSFSAGLQTARTIDNGSIAGMGGGAGMAQNWQDLNAEKATSALLRKAQLNGNWQYSTGQGKAGGTLLKGWKGAALKDWTFTNGVTWMTGTPLTATVGGNLAEVTGTGITGTVRANSAGGYIAAPPGSNQPFNLAVFAAPASGHWGNAGRNTIPSPAIWGLNASLGRVFRLGEKRSADLRFDANNVINHVVVNGWSTVVNAYNYGLPTGTQSMRSMTANLRFRF